MASPADELFDYASQLTTPCQKRPERCEPRHVDAVFFDADGVIWDIEPHSIASSLYPPFKKIDDNTVEAGEGEWGYGWSKEPKSKPPLKPARKFKSKYFHRQSPLPDKHLVAKTEGGITTYTLEEINGELSREYESLLTQMPKKPSKGTLYEATAIVHGSQLPVPLSPEGPPAGLEPPKPTTSYKWEPRKTRVTLLPTFRDTVNKLDKSGIKMGVISLNRPGSVKELLKAFGLDDKFIEIRDSWDNKGKVFDELTTKHHIAPCNSIFVDDTMSNIEDVSKKCALALHMGKDIHKPEDILNYVLERK